MIPAILGEQDILKYLATTPGIITTNALDPGIYVREATVAKMVSSPMIWKSPVRIILPESSLLSILLS